LKVQSSSKEESSSYPSYFLLSISELLIHDYFFLGDQRSPISCPQSRTDTDPEPWTICLDTDTLTLSAPSSLIQWYHIQPDSSPYTKVASGLFRSGWDAQWSWTKLLAFVSVTNIPHDNINVSLLRTFEPLIFP
jgi:hypothetical protein